MADNIAAVAGAARCGRKAVIWAHNEHVALQSTGVGGYIS